MICDFFHKLQKSNSEDSNLNLNSEGKKLLEPEALKRRHKEVKEFTSAQDILKNGSAYFTSLTKDKENEPAYRIIHFYTGMDYQGMNDHERKKSTPKLQQTSLWQHYEEKNNIMSKELQKHIVKKDLFVFKGIDTKRFEMMKKTGDAKGFWGLKGTIIRDKGFVSTTLLASHTMKEKFRLKIKVPAGTHAAYVADISIVHSEKELLLDRDQSMVITNVKIKNGITTIECSLLEKSKPKSTST